MNVKKVLMTIVILVIIGSAAVWAMSPDIRNGMRTDARKLVVLNSPPRSLDQYYPTGEASIYLAKMFDMAGAMEGVGINVQEGDWINASHSFKAFSDLYENNSKLVPRWSRYYDTKLVDRIGIEINEKNAPAVFEDMGKLGESCDVCHTQNMFQVWIKYDIKDFDNISVNTTNPGEPVAPWPDAMEKYLAPSFDGMAINLAEGKRDLANQSFDTFKTQLLDFKDACKECHDTERKYFVDNDTIAIVDELGLQVNKGNITAVGPLIGQIGGQCYKCHMLHFPAQKMRTLMNR